MPISNTGSPLRNWTTIQHDGTLTSKSTTLSLNTSLGRLTHQLMNYHIHQTPTKVRMTTKTKHFLNQKSSSTPPTYPHFPNRWKEIWWPWSMTTPQPDTQNVMRQSEKLWNQSATRAIHQSATSPIHINTLQSDLKDPIECPTISPAFLSNVSQRTSPLISSLSLDR